MASLADVREIFDLMSDVHVRGYELAVEDWERDGALKETCNVYVTRGYFLGKYCPRPAGQGTSHVGAGWCVAHGGAKKLGRAHGSWLMAHAYAQARQISPWDALLEEVQDLAGQVRWLNAKLASAQDDDEIKPGGDLHCWVEMRDARGDRLAKVSKMCIDAGVAERLLHRVELHGRLLYEAAMRSAKELDIPEVEQLALVQSIARNVIALERAQDGTDTSGNWIPGETA
jgi:hypothetical protein